MDFRTRIDSKMNTEAEITREKFEIIGIQENSGDELVRESISFWKDAWRRLKRNKAALVALVILLTVFLISLIGPLISGHEFDALGPTTYSGPTMKNWFGTDSIGRDTFTRVCKGGRVSLMIGIVGAMIDTIVGSIYGGISGYFGGVVDDIMMRIIEIIGSIPYLVLVILVSMWIGKGVTSLIIAMTITGWLFMARLVRGQLLQIREQEYVLAATALGANAQRIISKHLIPNTLGVMIVTITFDIPGFIFGEAFLGYLGLGVQSPQTSWGSLASAARMTMTIHPWEMVFPALFISLTILSFQLLGDGLRDALDPKLRK